MFYWIARSICRVVLLMLRRWEVYGAKNLPDKGPVVVASNHISYWDPVVIGCALNRKVFFMAKGELFKIPVLGSLIRRLGAFPVNRDNKDRKAVYRALKLLKSEKLLGIFPEGTRSHTDKLLPPHPGMVLIAKKANAPILPVALEGTRGVFGKIRVYIGKPLDLNRCCDTIKKTDKEKMKDLSLMVMEEIRKLLDDHKR